MSKAPDNYDVMKKYLEMFPLGRERANKNRAIGNIVVDKYGSFAGEKVNLNLDKASMANIVKYALNMDRQWRKVLEDCPELRGTDYNEKEILEQEAEIELGYGGITRDKDKLKTL